MKELRDLARQWCMFWRFWIRYIWFMLYRSRTASFSDPQNEIQGTRWIRLTFQNFQCLHLCCTSQFRWHALLSWLLETHAIIQEKLGAYLTIPARLRRSPTDLLAFGLVSIVVPLPTLSWQSPRPIRARRLSHGRSGRNEM
jgi:hypothetical protein